VSNPLRTPDDYELFVYTIQERFPSVQRSTLTFVRRGASLARVAGELYFSRGLRLAVLQRIVYDRLPAVIDAYGYEIWRGDEKLFWYDSQPHPGDPVLEGTHPHHKHVPPNPRQNRVPAPNMSFDRPNLPGLIAELEQFARELGAKPERG
jgi:hypothetical protein